MELQGLALQALNMVKRDLEQHRGRDWLLAVYFQGEGIHRMEMVEALMEEKLGATWLSNSRAKNIGFGIVKKAIQLMTARRSLPDAVVFVSPSNCFKPTEALMKLDVDKQKAIMEGGAKCWHEAVDEGLLEMQRSLTSMAQTDTRVCLYTQAADHRVFLESPQVNFFNQQEFRGQLKMYS